LVRQNGGPIDSRGTFYHRLEGIDLQDHLRMVSQTSLRFEWPHKTKASFLPRDNETRQPQVDEWKRILLSLVHYDY